MGVIVDTNDLSATDLANIIRNAVVHTNSHKLVAYDEKGNRYDVADVQINGDVILLEIISK